MIYKAKQIETWKRKAQQWDELEDKISKFYPELNETRNEGTISNDNEEGEDEGGSLIDIGEAAAMAFGYI